jgi:hypothetical protein
MNIFIHQGYLDERQQKARRQQMIGFLCIAASFVLSFLSFNASTSFFIFLAYPFLLVGFPVWSMGRATLRRLNSMPRTDTLLNAEVKGYNNKYSLHHYAKVGDTWIQHMLVTPVGLIVMVGSDAMGPVTCTGGDKGDSWKAPTNLLDRIAGTKPPIGNPSLEVDAAVAAARRLLSELSKADVPVRGLVMFARNPAVTVENCSYQGVPLNEVKMELKDMEAAMGPEPGEQPAVGQILTADDRRRLDKYLAPQTLSVEEAAAAKTAKRSRPAKAAPKK